MGTQSALLVIFNALFFFFFFSFANAFDEPPFACNQASFSTKSLLFCDTKLPIKNRVEDLLSRLTIDEKISQLVNTAPPITRLGIPAYQWWSESLHGVAASGPGIHFNGTLRSATSFPQVILSAASFDAHLWFRIAQAIGIEARGVYNAGQANGMTFWAPNINIFRDPRWGRGQETPGEDPLVTGKYSVSYVRGVQGDSFKVKTLMESTISKPPLVVTVQDLADTYQPPFQKCIEEGRANGIMCAYNRVNGVPNCADFNLLTKKARGMWGFDGYITSDCDAVAIIYENQRYTKTPEDAVADVLKAGKSSLQQKKLSEADLDRALFNLFSTRMKLGLFNGDPRQLPFGDISPNRVCSADHQALALEAARDGIVLLKNSARLLPLPQTKTNSLAVIGPNADVVKTLLGNYYGPPCISISPLQALKKYVSNTLYHQGCDYVNCTSVSISNAVDLAKSVDYVVLIMGLDQTQEREEKDRVDLVLPGKQASLILSVAEAAKKPVILVILSGGPVDVSFAKYNKNIGGIIWAGYPGEAGGIALAEIIFGDHNPGGRLPVTWYPQYFTKVPMTDMRMRPDAANGYPGRTYRFYTGKSVFKFGYGLSYTNYAYKFSSVELKQLDLNQYGSLNTIRNETSASYLSVSEIGKENCDKLKFLATIGVRNTGEMSGKHPVLLFVEPSVVRYGSPIKQLVGFQSVHLNAGEEGLVEFGLSPCEHLSKANEEGLMVMEGGSHFLVVGEEKHQISIVL
ncbi:hypothetical protein Syun_013641 [Stephania yunnanensis]|uniref:Fibronectin type III-like domain-containing protein n=1 Tax=Stephania yunnanensis TaxID=152371 RepID=A0AAP0JIX4_9MAGN